MISTFKKLYPFLTILPLFASADTPSKTPQTPESVTSRMKAHIFRLKPGQDLTEELKAWAKVHKIKAASIVSAVGSLKKINIRYANQPTTTSQDGFFEIVSLVGTINEDSMHLHGSVSNGKGETLGGHLAAGNIIYTTAEIVVAEFEDAIFTRKLDPVSGYQELKPKPKP